MKARTALVLALALLPACTSTSGEDVGQSAEALKVCHTTVVEGLDVSEFQGASTDWTKVQASGRGFAIARIADGAHADADFQKNYAGIRAAGMVRGAYLFWRPQIAAATQAKTIIDAVGTLEAGDLPPTLDIECMCPYHSGGGCASNSYSDCVSPSTAAAGIQELYDTLTAHYGRPPMVYTGSWFWDGTSYLNDALTLPDAPLWVSGYITGCVTVPKGWSDWAIWQYSDGTGLTNIPGTTGGDRDRWNGDLASLQAFATPPSTSSSSGSSSSSSSGGGAGSGGASSSASGSSSGGGAGGSPSGSSSSGSGGSAVSSASSSVSSGTGGSRASTGSSVVASSSSASGGPGSAEAHSGCSCATPSTDAASGVWLVPFAACAAALGRRRRRPRRAALSSGS